MSRFIAKSNLPESDVKALICGGLNKELIKYFTDIGIEIYLTQVNKNIDPSVSEHCDLSALYLGNGKIITDKCQFALIERLQSDGFDVINTVKFVSGSYSGDCILNHTLIDKYIIGNSKIFDEAVLRECKNFKLISTKQGYCKCSVLVIDEKSVITDDESIARSCRLNGIESLLISKGDIRLNGHEYGFIGGASGKISKDKVVFFGDITKHRDYLKINEFISERGMKIISFDFPLTDFGGIIPVKENNF
ncbi:MAG: hypothetical protein IJB74_01060 [Clostridia bacterium]|nr:hypothetical protein [Clostridia bacterium]